LVGGPTPNSGHVFAINPTTGVEGPVCDDRFEIVDVSKELSSKAAIMK